MDGMTVFISNIKIKNLDEHLIKGLNVEGVPKQLKNTVFAFNYNDFETLKSLCKRKILNYQNGSYEKYKT